MSNSACRRAGFTPPNDQTSSTSAPATMCSDVLTMTAVGPSPQTLEPTVGLVAVGAGRSDRRRRSSR